MENNKLRLCCPSVTVRLRVANTKAILQGNERFVGIQWYFLSFDKGSFFVFCVTDNEFNN